MRKLVESLKRLYFGGKVTAEKVNELKDVSKITEEEASYILDI